MCSDSARLDAEVLLARAIDMPRSYLYAHPEDTLDELALARLNASIEQRAAGTPIAYITGMREFWSLQLQVSAATLVPRPETELLVELALRRIPRRAAWQILDLGTGSGAIAVAIASERPACEVTAVDVSPEALAVAAHNVRLLDIANVECLLGDWTKPVATRKFQLIVSNPPYVAAGDERLAALGAEPHIALVSGNDGLQAVRRLSQECKSVLADHGCLILEHGEEQRDAVSQILEADGWRDIGCHDDYAGRPRAISAEI